MALYVYVQGFLLYSTDGPGKAHDLTCDADGVYIYIVYKEVWV